MLIQNSGDVYTYSGVSWDKTHETKYLVSPPCGCFSIYTRDLKIKNLKITYDGIRIDKKQEYKSTCTFTITKS